MTDDQLRGAPINAQPSAVPEASDQPFDLAHMDPAVQLSAIVQSSHDAIIGRDLNGRIISWNPGAERLYGYRAADVIGRHSRLLADATHHQFESALLERIAAGQHVEMFRTQRMHRTGEVLNVSLSVSPIVDDHNVIVGMATSSRDVGELIISESRFQSMIEAAPDAMVSVDGDGRITFVNNQVERLFGWSRVELIGEFVETLVPKGVRPMHSGLRNAYFLDPVSRPMGDNRKQLYAQRKDGTTFEADISLGSVRIGSDLVVTAAVRDVSDRIAAQNALRDSEANFRQLAESVDVAFVLRRLNPHGFLYVSPGFARIYGYDPVQDQEDPDVTMNRIHPDDYERVQRDYWQIARRGEPAQAEWRIIRPDGEIRWVSARTTPVVDADGVVRRTAGTADDITERKRIETALQAAHGAAQKANAAKNEFLSRMSHELRTPLNAVLGFAQLLEMDSLKINRKDAVRHILHGGRHLLGLIDDVLDITKIETDRLDVSMEPVLISELLTETVKLMGPLAATMDVALKYNQSQDSGKYVWADRRRLRQVLVNLLSNAVKYNRRGGTVAVSWREIVDQVSLDVLVTDTGFGIAADDLPRLYTPFDRLGAEATGIEGAGVGLALSQRLMSNMGGTLRAESQVDVGSTFIMSIPITRPADSTLDVASETTVAAVPISGPTCTLVYVEDNNSNVELMATMLALRPNWRMSVARDGAAGLDLILRAKPDLVLLDLHLPVMDGSELLSQLRTDPTTKNLHIVILSADANPHQRIRLLAAGANDYVTKPLDMDKVLDLLDVRQLVANQHPPPSD